MWLENLHQGCVNLQTYIIIREILLRFPFYGYFAYIYLTERLCLQTMSASSIEPIRVLKSTRI